MRRHGEASAKKSCELCRAPVHNMGCRRILETREILACDIVCLSDFEMQLQAVWLNFNRSDENGSGCIILWVVCRYLRMSADVCRDCVESKEKVL